MLQHYAFLSTAGILLRPLFLTEVESLMVNHLRRFRAVDELCQVVSRDLVSSPISRRDRTDEWSTGEMSELLS